MTDTNTPQPIPNGYTTVTPWIIVKDADGCLAFLNDVFEAEELGPRVRNEDGSIGHAEARIGDAVVMTFDSGAGWPATLSSCGSLWTTHGRLWTAHWRQDHAW